MKLRRSHFRVASYLLAVVAVQGCDAEVRSFSPVVHGDTVLITGEPTCKDCTIALSDSISIGADTDWASLTPAIWASRRSDGHLFVTGLYGIFGVAEYDPSGRFLRILGKKGSGPAEFGGPPTRPTLVRGDTLVVYDQRLRRFMRISPDGRLLGPFTTTMRTWDVTASPDGILLVTGALPSTDPFEYGHPAHFIRLDGSVIRSVGDSLRDLGADRAASFKQVAVSPLGSIALANFYGYDITVHFPDGTRRVLSRRAEWFVPLPPPDDTQPKVGEMWFDQDEHLWVTLFIPQKLAENTTADKTDELLMMTQAADNVVEVFDPATGELLASRRFDTPFFVSNGLGIQPLERPSGLIGYTIWRPSLIALKESGK